jgi:membrane fusion protein (multidrug efflux system)
VVLDNKDRELMPGMLARVRLEVERKDSTVVVPYRALIIEMGAGGKVIHRAFVLEGAKGSQPKAKERELALGIIEGRRVEVTRGLSFGDELVTRGQHQLKPGSAVRVVERLGADGKSVKPLASRPTGQPPASKTR